MISKIERMKKIFLMLFLLNVVFVFSENKNVITSKYYCLEGDSIYKKVEKTPSFPGGDLKMQEFIKKNIHTPFQGTGIGTVISNVTFVVSETGELKDIKILKGAEHREGITFDKEAIAVIKKMPNWIPGEYKGKKVAVQYDLPIKFEVGSLQ